MKIIELEQGSEKWLEFRRGKITGTRLGDVYSDKLYNATDVKRELYANKIEFKKSAPIAELEALLPSSSIAKLREGAPKKVGFYETIAERLAIPADDERPMDRGLRLEEEASEEFTKRYKKELEIVGCWQSDEDPRIINSPDRQVKPKKGKITEAVEIKCLGSARHIEAVIENIIPSTYESQVIQYFIVNPDLEKLYFVFYDPRLQSVPFYCIEVTREELGDKPEKYKQFQLEQLKQMDEIVARLAF